MQINRLFEIVYILLNKGTVTARSLADKFGVSSRTIYRDVDSLEAAGIPLYTERGKNGGICLVKNFSGEGVEVPEAERKEIISQIEAIRQTPYVSTKKMLAKIADLLNDREDMWLDVDFESVCPSGSKLFEEIRYAIMDKHIVTFDYHNTHGDIIEIKAEPLQLCYKDNKWYLRTYSITDRSFEVYKIVRINEFRVRDDKFEPRHFEGDDLQSAEDTVSVTLRVAQDNAERVFDEFHPDNVKRDIDGNYLVKGEYPENDSLYEYILSFGESAEVVSPKWIRDTVIERVKNMYKRYF